MPKNDQILPKIGIFGQFGPGHAGLFGALLVGLLVVVARGLYLARHLFTLCTFIKSTVPLLILQPKTLWDHQDLETWSFLKTFLSILEILERVLFLQKNLDFF